MLQQQANFSTKSLAGFVAGALLAAGLGTALAGLVASASLNSTVQIQAQANLTQIDR